MPLNILHQDSAVLVLNKPACVHTVDLAHGGSSRSGKSLAQMLRAQFPELESVAPNEHDLGCVNRLDYETSGLVLVAKSSKVWSELHDQFSSKLVEKTYLARLEGRLGDKIEVDTPLGTRARRGKRVYAIKTARKGYRVSQALTTFMPLRYDIATDSTIVQVLAHAGVRHQIRAHAASIMHPLVGDLLYGSKRHLGDDSPPFALHALRYRYLHPISRQAIEVSAPAPEYLS